MTTRSNKKRGALVVVLLSNIMPKFLMLRTIRTFLKIIKKTTKGIGRIQMESVLYNIKLSRAPIQLKINSNHISTLQL